MAAALRRVSSASIWLRSDRTSAATRSAHVSAWMSARDGLSTSEGSVMPSTLHADQVPTMSAVHGCEAFAIGQV